MGFSNLWGGEDADNTMEMYRPGQCLQALYLRVPDLVTGSSCLSTANCLVLEPDKPDKPDIYLVESDLSSYLHRSPSDLETAEKIPRCLDFDCHTS